MPRSAVVPEEIPRHQSVCQYNCCENSKSRPFSRALLLLCTQILSYKCRQCHSKAVDGQKTEPFHLCVGPIARHCHLSECIDIGLHDYVCKRNDRVLHSGRQSDLDDLDKDSFVKTDFSNLQSIAFLCPQQLPETKECTHNLRDHVATAAPPTPV